MLQFRHRFPLYLLMVPITSPQQSPMRRTAGFTFSSPTIQVKLSQEAPAPTPTASPAPATKKLTITCVKGKTTKSVTGVKPVCPTGYKKR